MQGLWQVSVSLENTRFRQHKRPSLSMIASFTFLAKSARLLRSSALSDVFYWARAAHLLRHLAQLNVFWRISR